MCLDPNSLTQETGGISTGNRGGELDRWQHNAYKYSLDKQRSITYIVHAMRNYEQEIHYRLLKMLSKEPNITQRDMAKRMGISLGKMNYCVNELAAKAWIKIIPFKGAKNRTLYTYMLTPKGLQEKAGMTLSFLKRKLVEYEEIKKQIRELHYETEEKVFNDSDSELIVAVKKII